MTRIDYIHGIAQAGEMAQRGLEVGAQPFLPYTAMSRGEMRVALAAERATIYAQAYPELREYQQAATMLNNALYNSLHGGSPLARLGAIHDPVLQSAARIIANATRQTKPASTAYIGRTSLAHGIVPHFGIGAFTELDCTIYARDMSNRKHGKNESSGWWKNPIRKKEYKETYKNFEAECAVINAVQKVVNERIESSAHHVTYKSILAKFPGLGGTRLDNKRLDHVAAIEGLANVAFVSDKKLIDEWTENGILRYNSQGGVGPLDSQTTGMAVGTTVANVTDAALQAAYDQFRKKAGISFDPVTVTAVVTLVAAIGKALKDASEFQKALNEKKGAAAQVAKGYGTTAFSAEEGDWSGSGPGPLNTGGNSDLLLYGGMALGAYLLLK